MKTLIIANLENKQEVAKISIDLNGLLGVRAKKSEIKKEVEALLDDLFDKATTYRTSCSSGDNNQSFQTIAKKAEGDEYLYALWDAIAGGNYRIGGHPIRAYVKEEEQ